MNNNGANNNNDNNNNNNNHDVTRAMTPPRYMRDKNRRAWENSITCPTHHGPPYPLPWRSGHDMDHDMLQPFCPRELYVGYIPLPFFSIPMWPCTWNDTVKGKPGTCYNDKEHPERFSSLFCVKCKQRVRMGQVVLYMISGFYIHAPNTPVMSSDVRLVCTLCAHHDMAQLSYIPYILSIQLGTRMEPFKKSVLSQEDVFTRRKYACIACDSTNGSRVILNANRRRMILCHRKACVHTFAAMFHTRPLYFGGYPYMSAKQRIRELLMQLAQDQRDGDNLIRFMRWIYCAQCHVPINRADFLECGKCQSVLFCSIECAKRGLKQHQTWCIGWQSWFDAARLIVLHMRSVSLAQTVSVEADLVGRIDALILQKRGRAEGGSVYNI